jgi:hypothetical protein
MIELEAKKDEGTHITQADLKTALAGAAVTVTRLTDRTTDDEWPTGYRGPRDHGMIVAMYGIPPSPFYPETPWAPVPVAPVQPLIPQPKRESLDKLVPDDKKDTDPPPTDPNGYHKRKIARGKLGEISKVKEECEEFEDAIEQGIVIMAHAELADIYGALKALAAAHGLKMSDLEKMDSATERAFNSGRRK